MKREIINREDIDEKFCINKIYVYTNEKSGYSLLLGENGSIMIIDKYLLEDIKEKKINENFKFKLIQHGLASLKDNNISISDNVNKNIYFVIDVTKKCNFNCIYCFRDLSDTRVIDDKTLKDICQYILNIAKERKLDSVRIQVWGGEPISAIEKLEYIYNFFKNTNIVVKIDVETNGSLITDKLAKKLHDMNVNIGVSIDGLEKHQDIQRKLVNNESSNTLVREGIKNLQKYYGKNLSGITVITKYNYKDIADIIGYFINELNIPSMKFNIVKDNPNAKEEKISLTSEEVREFANKLYDAVELYNAMGFKFSEGNIQTRKENLIERSGSNCCISNGCKGGRSLISIDMNGDIYPCEMTDYKEVKIGSIYDKGILTGNKELEKQIDEAKSENIYFQEKINEECRECPWEYFCKGGCTSRIIYSNGEMKYDKIECEFNKVIYERIIENMLKNIK